MIVKQCKSCGTTTKPKAGFCRGMCRSCYDKWRWKEKREERLKAHKERSSKNKGKIRGYALYRKFKITHQDYLNMLANQNGKCKICNSASTGDKNKKHFLVDHCHKTGKIRGLLCRPCNQGLGAFKDSIESIIKAGMYLSEHN